MILHTIVSFVCLVTFRVRSVNSSHWIVAENGKIQAQLDSVYHLRAPHDLIAFLDQEKRVEKLEEYYEQMLEKVSMINQKRVNLDGVTDVESKLYTTDADCLNTGEPLNADDLNFSFFDDGKDLEDFKFLESSLEKIPSDAESSPNCSKFSSLEFSMATFPHLQVLAEEWHLEDNQIVEKLASDMFKFPEMGKILNHELSQNHSSWFHYNLASIYWRKIGKPNNAIECAKRAVHFSSRQHKDISLLNLGSLLRYNEYLVEAAIILHAALDHAPQKPLIHFTLANVYLFLGDFNRSIVFYDNVLHLQPNWRAAQRIRHFVRCNWKHQANLKLLRDNLHDILHHSHEYQELQIKWLKLHEELLNQVMPLELRLIRQDALSSFLANKSLLGKTCGYNKRDGELILKCNYLPNKVSAMHEKQLETKIRLQVLANNALSQILKINEKLLQFSIEPPQLNTKASSPQFKGLDELQLPIRSVKNQHGNELNQRSSQRPKADAKNVDSSTEDIYHPVSGDSNDNQSSDENDDDDGKLELLFDDSHNTKKQALSDAVNSKPPSIENGLPTQNSENLKKPITNGNLFSSFQEKEEAKPHTFTRNTVGYENVGTFVGNTMVASQLREKISDLIRNIKDNLKKLADNEQTLQSEMNIAFHDHFGNILAVDKDRFFGMIVEPTEDGEVQRQEFEIILKTLKSLRSDLPNKIPNFSEINLASKCSKHFCLSSKETNPLAQELKFASSLKEDEEISSMFTEHFSNGDEFLDILSQADISLDLLSLLKVSSQVDDSPVAESDDLECQLEDHIIPDLTVDTYTEGNSMMPEPKLLKVLKKIVKKEEIGADRIKEYIGKILEDTDVWSAATIAALFWRYSGDAQKTVICLQQAFSASPEESRHNPLLIVSYILLTIGHPNEALFLASLAIQITPHSILSHLTLYRIFSSAGDQKKAQIFRSSSLALLTSYSPNLTSR